MSEDANIEPGVLPQEAVKINNKQAFLKSSNIAARVVKDLNLLGFQMGGGAVDFVLKEYRRTHRDIDMVYVVGSKKWPDYLSNPNKVSSERVALKNINQEPEFCNIRQTTDIGMEIMGAPGVKMQGGELPLSVDFIEAYKDDVDGEDDIFLPIYEGASYIKIPAKETVEAEIDGVVTKVPSVEVQYLMKKQAAGLKRTSQGGPPPDIRPKARRDMNDLRERADMEKVRELEKRGVGFNFSPSSSAKFRATQLYRAILG